jgi:hypothetical protein
MKGIIHNPPNKPKPNVSFEIKFSAFIKENSQKGLVSGDKSHRLTLHELKIDNENIMKLAIAPTNQEFEVIMQTIK